jgi:hypothetical protein
MNPSPTEHRRLMVWIDEGRSALEQVLSPANSLTL